MLGPWARAPSRTFALGPARCITNRSQFGSDAVTRCCPGATAPPSSASTAFSVAEDFARDLAVKLLKFPTPCPSPPFPVDSGTTSARPRTIATSVRPRGNLPIPQPPFGRTTRSLRCVTRALPAASVAVSRSRRLSRAARRSRALDARESLRTSVRRAPAAMAALARETTTYFLATVRALPRPSFFAVAAASRSSPRTVAPSSGVSTNRKTPVR